MLHNIIGKPILLKHLYGVLVLWIFFYKNLFQIVVGNFDPNLISTRCSAFESLLGLIASESRLRDAPAAITFFQDIELNDAKRLINEGKFDQALSVLETSFKLLNKVSNYNYTSFSLRLCRLKWRACRMSRIINCLFQPLIHRLQDYF